MEISELKRQQQENEDLQDENRKQKLAFERYFTDCGDLLQQEKFHTEACLEMLNGHSRSYVFEDSYEEIYAQNRSLNQIMDDGDELFYQEKKQLENELESIDNEIRSELRKEDEQDGQDGDW